MTVWYMLTITGSPTQLRVGNPKRYARIRPENVRKFKQLEVTMIQAKDGNLIAYAEEPDYELDSLEEYELDSKAEDPPPWWI